MCIRDRVRDALAKGPRRESERVIHLATVAVGLFLAWAGWRYVADTRGSVSAAIGRPMQRLFSQPLASGERFPGYVSGCGPVSL